MSRQRAEYAAYAHERFPIGSPPDHKIIDEHLLAWRTDAYLDESEFMTRMRYSDHSAESLGALLAGVPFVPERSAVSWCSVLDEILAQKPTERRDVRTRLYGSTCDRMLFEGLVGRFVSYYERRLWRDLDSEDSAAEVASLISPAAKRSVVEGLVANLTYVSHRTLILEMNVARVRGHLGDRVSDEPSAAGYDTYDRVLLQDNQYLADLFEEYPVLARTMVECGQRWLECTLEMFVRLAADLDELRVSGLVSSTSGELTEIRTGLGDSHHGGRSVAALEFIDGTAVIYKPRPVDSEFLFSELLTQVNDLGVEHQLRGMRVLCRPGYGWCEFVRRSPCADIPAVEAFYVRLGGLIALAHLIGANDIHQENLIAAGETPVIIDLETILQPKSVRGLRLTLANEKALDLLSRSILATSMVPCRTIGDGWSPGVDPSAFSGGAERLESTPGPWLADPYTDQMRIVSQTRVIKEADNRPFLDNAVVCPGDFATEVFKGFREVYQLIAENKNQFISVINRAEGLPIRYLIRQTRRYDLFRYERFHPKYLRDGMDTDRLLEKLWSVISGSPELSPLVEKEKRQLLRADIPSFGLTPEGTELRSGPDWSLPHFFAEPPLAEIRAKLLEAGESDLRAQSAMLEDSLGTVRRVTRVAPEPWTPSTEIGVDRARVRWLVQRLVTELADQALFGRDDCTWIGLTIDGIRDETLDYRPLNTGLYDGMAGMALMFGYAATILADQRCAEMTARSIAPVVRDLRAMVKHRPSVGIGAFNGVAGNLYCLAHLYVLTGESHYAELVDEALPLLIERVSATTAPDLISGLAGCAVVAGDLWNSLDFAGYAKIVEICVERLFASAVRVGSGAAWRHSSGDPLLGGFSHGAAGIGWALVRAGMTLNSTETRELGELGLAYDRSLRVPGTDSWQDLRNVEDRTGIQQKSPTLWCHGTTGIGMSRLLAFREDPRDWLLEEAKSAVRGTQAAGQLGNQCLCHGDFGSVDLFNLASTVIPSSDPFVSELDDYREKFIVHLIDNIERDGYEFGRVTGRNVPGLLIGKSGVCLSLLRLLTPTTPSVLSLDMPPAASDEGEMRA